MMSYAAQWDAASPLHKGRAGSVRPTGRRLVVGSNGASVAANQAGYLNPPAPAE